jgi:two-component system, LytTR family, sensor kinase
VKNLEIALHVLFWLFSLWLLNQNFAFVTEEVFYIDGRRHEVVSRNYQLLSLITFTLVGKMVAAYGNAFWALPRFLKDRRPGLLFPRAAGLVLAGVLVEVMAISVISRYNIDVTLAGWARMWRLNLLLYALYLGISVAYVMARHWQRNERPRRQLQEEKLAAELNFLKSQVNPHFLFNTLNNLFALAERHRNPELAQGIAGLSELMRYMLYDCRADRVSLEKEVHFIEALIGMQQLRLSPSDEVTISFEVTGDIRGRRIAPMILLPFVENAFKHGIRWASPSFVKIRLAVSGETLDFSVENSLFEKRDDPHREDAGIGLDNVRRRLELIYPYGHYLEVREGNGKFTIQLEINENPGAAPPNIITGSAPKYN